MLRRRHLGCGTRMYNNGKNIYMETAENYAKLLEEGVEIYHNASETGFRENPWESQATQISHRDRFPLPDYTPDVEMCWDKVGTTGGGKGTSPLSKKKESDDNRFPSPGEQENKGCWNLA